MWNNSKGSLLLELVISLMIVSLFILTVFPIVSHMTTQTRQERLEIIGKTILYEQMLKSYKTGSYDLVVERDNKQFQIERVEGEYCAKSAQITICLPSWEK